MFVNPGESEMRQRLSGIRTIAVVGLSDKPVRDSYSVAEYLVRTGYTVVPVNPTIRMWKNLQSFPDLATAQKAATSVGKKIDLVVVFRRASEAADVLKEVVHRRIPAAWCQLGVIDWDAAAWAREHGVWMVMDHCIAVEHRKLIGAPVGA